MGTNQRKDAIGENTKVRGKKWGAQNKSRKEELRLIGTAEARQQRKQRNATGVMSASS
jgi:hypothetical protein